MFHWLSGLAQLGADVARREVKRLVLMIVFISLAVLCIMLALGFFLAGIFLAIEQSLGPIAACFIMFGGLLLIALVFFLLSSRGGKRRHRRREIEEELDELADERPGVAGVAASFAFGLARGFTRRRRR